VPMIDPSLTTVVNWAFFIVLVLSLGHVFTVAWPRRIEAADTDPKTWPRWLALSACLLFMWAAFLWCIPRFSPTYIVRSRVDRAYAVEKHRRDGSTYLDYFVSFRPSGPTFWPGPFAAPQKSLDWPTTVDATYSYRNWDRELLEFRTIGNGVVWEDPDPNYSGCAFLAISAGVVLLLVSFLLTRDVDTSMHLSG